jgi:hypothetical protein
MGSAKTTSLNRRLARGRLRPLPELRPTAREQGNEVDVEAEAAKLVGKLDRGARLTEREIQWLTTHKAILQNFVRAANRVIDELSDNGPGETFSHAEHSAKH